MKTDFARNMGQHEAEAHPGAAPIKMKKPQVPINKQPGMGPGV